MSGESNLKVFPAERVRRHPRIRLERTVQVKVWGHELTLSASSLSFSGAFLQGKANFPVGTDMEIRVDCDGHAVSCAAKVVHNHRNGVGVIFLTPSDRFLDELYQTVHHQVVQNVKAGHHEDTVPGRIALLARADAGYEILFTTHLSPHGVWALSDGVSSLPDLFWVTLPERGLYDSQCQIEWREQDLLGLRFIDPPAQFRAAWQNVLSVYLGD